MPSNETVEHMVAQVRHILARMNLVTAPRQTVAASEILPPNLGGVDVSQDAEKFPSGSSS